jgi:hypothetical protein
MMLDPHNPGVSFLCLVWKAGPNILWSLGGAAHNQFLQIRRDNLIIVAARISLMSLLADFAGKPRTVKPDRLAKPCRQVTAMVTGGVSPSSQSCSSASESHASSMRL